MYVSKPGVIATSVGACLLWVSALASAGTVSDGLDTVSYDEIRGKLQSAPPGVREGMSRDQMGRFVSNMLVDRRLLKAATTAGVPEQAEVKARIARAVQGIVIQAFIDGEMDKIAKTLPDLTELARERYLADKAQYAVPEAIRVAHILFAVNAEDEDKTDAIMRARAEKVLAALKNGGDFAALAREHSDDPGSKKHAGELLAWMEKGRLVPPFEAAAYALKPGELSGVVQTRFGYHIIRLIEHRDAMTRPFDEVKDQIVDKLRNDTLAQKRTEFMKPYLGPQPIEIDDATLAELKKPSGK